MGANRMTSTPWHTEILQKKESDSRRHRSRCKYYRHSDKQCSWYFTRCTGSAHCPCYKEITISSPKPAKKSNGLSETPRPIKKSIAKEEPPIPKANEILQLGDTIQHVTYGEGLVVHVRDDTFKVLFENDMMKDFVGSSCFSKSLVKKITK